jgi:hypothetical protein
MDLASIPPAPGRGRAEDPRYCPRCGHIERTDATLCRPCGETLEPQGYCDVCEAHWPLSPGTPCPKHELGLAARAPSRSEMLGPTGDRSWVTVKSFADRLRAEAPRIRLESEGIPTFLEGERMGGPSMYQVATGGVKLQVPESLVADARVLLSQSWSGDESDDEDLDDAWDDLAPDPAATWRDLGRAAVLFVLFAPLLLGLLSLWLNAR